VTLVAATLICVVGVLMTACAVLGSAVIARHRAAAAADLGALSGAIRLPAGRNAACAAAETAARSLGSTVRRCDVDGVEVIVTVSAALGFGASVAGPATAAARAGPIDTP
jgi:secretion/DNA translocation related TadE-like protein